MDIVTISARYSVTGQIAEDDVAALASAGFHAVVCNRPDNEEPGQPSAARIAAACDAAGLSFSHIPMSGANVIPGGVETFEKLLASVEGPVLGYCRSGQRSALLWSFVRR